MDFDKTWAKVMSQFNSITAVTINSNLISYVSALATSFAFAIVHGLCYFSVVPMWPKSYHNTGSQGTFLYY